jgi:hypothetical protein
VKYKTAFNLLHIAMAMLVLPATSIASDALRAAAVSCVRTEILNSLKYRSERPKKVAKLLAVLEKECSEKKFKLCKDATLTAMQRTNVLHTAAQLDNETVRTAFLNAFPIKHDANFKRLYRYIEKQLPFCIPPVHQVCESHRWQNVVEDFLAHEGRMKDARFLARWKEDNLEERMDGLHDFMHEQDALDTITQDPETYHALLQSPGLSADSLSIVSEQANMKPFNNISKEAADKYKAMRLRSFRWHLNQQLEERGLKLSRATRIDFKTDRILEPLLKLQEDHPRQLEAAVNVAAQRANEEMTLAIHTRFPEFMYIMDMYDPARWSNTATFYMPGYSPRLNEALASFKARLMREAPALDNPTARDQFVSFAEGAIEFADEMKQLDAKYKGELWGEGKLLGAGIIESNGSFTRKTAEIIRKNKPERLAEALTETFKIPVEPLETKLLLLQWARQDMLSLPLITIDKMPSAPKNVAILGGDGIAGGAIDAWTKMQSLLAHRDMVLNSKLSPDQKVQRVFQSLVEADNNASAMIRSAPMILRDGLVALPKSTQEKIGLFEIHTSADDAMVPLEHLKGLSEAERDKFYKKLAWNVSKSKRPVTLRENANVQKAVIGPEILRMFLGYDKAGAESAEQFLKPIEEKISTKDFLGPSWRKDYPDVALFAVQEGGEKFKVYAAGKGINSTFRLNLHKALYSIVRSPDQAQLEFVTASPR